GIQYRDSAIPRRPACRVPRLQPEGILRHRGGAAQGARSSAAGEVLTAARVLMAAYGLYTHIQANKRRSIVLLIGLFFLVYLMVYAGALAAGALSSDAQPGLLLRRAVLDAVRAAPFATLGTAVWIWIAYKFHQGMIDAVTGGRIVNRQEA